MKNISNPKLIRALLCMCMVFSAWISSAQNYQHHEIMMNGEFEYEFASFPWPNPPSSASNGETELEYIGVLNGMWQNKLTYTPSADFVGLDSFQICYNFTPDNTFGCLYFEVEVIDYSVVAVDDYVSANISEAVSVNVLANDISSSGSFDIKIATLANNGHISVDSDSSILFTPDAGFKGAAQFHYTVCDVADKCDIGMVTIFYDNDDENEPSEYLNLSTKKNGFIDLIIPMHEDFGFQALPNNGNAEIHNADGVVRYSPYIDFTGIDNFTCYYQHQGVTKTINYQINVLNVASENNFAANDFAVTAIDESVTFNVLDNDATFSYVQSMTQPLNGTATRSLGVVTYTPNTGFEGAESFEYTVCLLGTPSCETSTIYVTTSNYAPAAPEFTLQTAKNNPLVVDYKTNIDNWTFTGPVGDESDMGGIVEIFDGFSSQTINGQLVEGYNLLVYTPPSDEFDIVDEFEIEYCAPNGSCQTVKIYVDLIDIPETANTDELCVTDCVFPGDANNDGIVNMADVLPVGFCTGVVGPSRPNPSSEWYGQYSEDWEGPMGAIEKHVDTDGDGEITGMDTVAINTYYGKTSNIVAGPVATLENMPLYFIPRTPNPGPGDLVQIDVMLGTPGSPAFDVYGLSFSLGYDAEIVTEGSMTMTFNDNSWAGYNSPMLSFAKDRYEDNRIDVAYTRTSEVSANGYGIIGQLEFVIIDEVDLRLNEYIFFNLNFDSSPVTMNAAGNYVTIAGADLQFKISTQAGLNDSTSPLVTYPNPAENLLNVYLNGSDELEQVKIYDLIGNLMYHSGDILEKSHQVDVSSFHNGLYIVNAYTTREMISIKTQVEHK